MIINNLFVSRKDYDAIKKGKDVLIVVEAKGEEPIYAHITYDAINNNFTQILKKLFKGD